MRRGLDSLSDRDAVCPDALFAALRESGYGGPVILEPYLALIRSDDALQRAVSHLRAAMKTD